jgi:hypothetical protein
MVGHPRQSRRTSTRPCRSHLSPKDGHANVADARDEGWFLVTAGHYGNARVVAQRGNAVTIH